MELGYRSADDAEQFAAEILGRDPGHATGPIYVGGPFVETPLGKPNVAIQLGAFPLFMPRTRHEQE